MIASDVDVANAYWCLGVVARARGNKREAEQHFRRSIELDSASGSHADLGELLLEMKRFDEAEAELRNALESDPSDIRARVALGGVYLERDMGDDKRAAVRELCHAWSLDPYHEEAARGYAVALWHSGRPEEAEKVLRSTLARLEEPKRWLLHVILSRILAQRGDESGDDFFYKEALKELGNAKLCFPGDDLPYFDSGVIHLKTKNLWDARKDFARAVDLNPDNFEARRYRDQLRREMFRNVVRASFVGGVAIAVVSLAQAGVLWGLYLTGRVSETVLATLMPILMGLFVVAFLLPALVALKLPGLEARFSSKGESVSAAAAGAQAFVRSDSGLRGLPRIGTGSARTAARRPTPTTAPDTPVTTARDTPASY